MANQLKTYIVTTSWYISKGKDKGLKFDRSHPRLAKTQADAKKQEVAHNETRMTTEWKKDGWKYKIVKISSGKVQQ